MKVCSKCKNELEETEFYKDKSRGDGSDNKCKTCAKEKSKENRKRRPRKPTSEYNREMWLRRKYGITTEEYVTLETKQQSKCLICGDSCELVVDHCHTNGHVRGLLCNSCNKGLGFFKDNIEYLNSAIKYLREKGDSE